MDLISTALFRDIGELIEKAKKHVAREFAFIQLLLNWHIGCRINQEVLNNERAQYGQQVILQLSERLTVKYGSGYDKTALSRMVKFSKLFPNSQIVATLSQQLIWPHIIQIIAIDDPLKREFYAEMSCVQAWDVRTLREKYKHLAIINQNDNGV
ncbi:MAG: hypothetical protein K2Q14_01920 [Gammaproteobacteria bacterium]|nr:hypothetical protein [Gammaproteobacteria bacterium]